jgi:ATP-dependent helicase IRC3
MKLRPYQSDALRVSKEKYDQGTRRQLVALPTGTGKTPLFVNLPTHHKFDGRTLVLVHREELAEQAARSVRKWFPEAKVGVEMGASYSSTGDDFIVGSVQTLSREGGRITKLRPEEFTTIICDEAHHSVAPSYKAVFGYFGLGFETDGFGRGSPEAGRPAATIRGSGGIAAGDRLLFGVTATPNRGDGQGLGQVYDEIIYQMSILDAIRQGWLVDIRGIKVKTNTSLDAVHIRAGDFAKNELEEAVNVDDRNHLIVQNWIKYGEDRQTIAFCVDIAHSQKLAETFRAYGVAAEAVWGVDPYRGDKLRYHKERKLRVLTNCEVLTEGYDDWQVACIIMARPTKSQLLFVQMAGRGTRIPEGIDNLLDARAAGTPLPKEDCLLLDVVDNTGRHSLVTLASIFGLPPKTDMKGQTVTKALATFQKVVDERTVDPKVLENVETLEEIPTAVEKADLFTVKWPEEVLQGSKLQWKKGLGDEYFIALPNDEHVFIFRDLIGKWDIKGTVKAQTFEHNGIDELPEAFRVADNYITMMGGREILTLLRRDSKWRKQQISKPQLAYLKYLYRNRPELWPNFDNLTKGEASIAIDKATKEAFGVKR